MTQSKETNTQTISINDSPYTFAIDGHGDAGYSTTVYTGSDDSNLTYSVDLNDLGTTDISYDWVNTPQIDPNEVEKMCSEYPALEKVWRNFKSVYDLVEQDYKGKKKAGELDDEIPF